MSGKELRYVTDVGAESNLSVVFPLASFSSPSTPRIPQGSQIKLSQAPRLDAAVAPFFSIFSPGKGKAKPTRVQLG